MFDALLNFMLLVNTDTSNRFKLLMIKVNQISNLDIDFQIRVQPSEKDATDLLNSEVPQEVVAILQTAPTLAALLPTLIPHILLLLLFLTEMPLFYQ